MLDAKTKQPFAIALKNGEPYAFEELWERWRDPAAGEAELLTFCMITTDRNEIISPIHNRMLVILPERDYHRWLEPGDPARPPIDLLRPYEASQMRTWPVDRKVGSVKNDYQNPRSRRSSRLEDCSLCVIQS